MNVLYKNIGISIIILLFGIMYSQTSRIDSLKAIYEAYNDSIEVQVRPRGGGIKKIKIKEQIYVDEKLHKTTDGYWVIKGIELYKKDKIYFEFKFGGKARIKINGELKLFSVGDSLEVGILILKERDKITKEFTGNVLKDRPYKAMIKRIEPRYVHIENYKPHSVIRLKPQQDPVIIYKSF